MGFAYVMSEGRGATDRLLADFAARIITQGLHPVGVVQVNTPRPKSNRCDMDVKVLPDGPVLRISQDLGADAKGCALNPDILEQAVVMVGQSLSPATDVLIVNKFGKHEADGKGFRETIGEAVALGIPVLAGLNSMNKPAFEDFAGGSATELPADPEAMEAWLKALREHSSA